MSGKVEHTIMQNIKATTSIIAIEIVTMLHGSISIRSFGNYFPLISSRLKECCVYYFSF